MGDTVREKAREYYGFGTKRMRELKVCSICKTAVSADKRFCTNCHAQLPSNTLYDIYRANHRFCEKCKTVLPENADYCPQCGEKQIKAEIGENKMAL